MCQAKGIPIKDWDDFEEKIVKGTEKVFQKFKKDSSDDYVSSPLYRGQADANGKLETTLERFLGKNIFVELYYLLIQTIRPIIESYTSERWQLPKIKDALEKIKDSTIPMALYEFMTYVRHNQFPSPLLDWTLSPYLAAFFAFSEDRKTNPAIYIYFSDVGYGKNSLFHDTPKICNMGQYIKTHKRHHLQQSKYTFCVSTLTSGYVYASHEEVFSLQEEGTGSHLGDLVMGINEIKDKQDIRKKYILPYSQRNYFLNKLNQMNINSYSLFGNEEGLMHKLAIEKLLLKDI